jgi:hypothetical protein
MSIYMKNVDNRFTQLAIGSDPNAFVNFDLEQVVLGTMTVSWFLIRTPS